MKPALQLEQPGNAITESTPVSLKLTWALLVLLAGGGYYAGSQLQAMGDKISNLADRVERVECHLDAKDCKGR